MRVSVSKIFKRLVIALSLVPLVLGLILYPKLRNLNSEYRAADAVRALEDLD